MKGIDQYKKNIETLIESTINGKIEWKKQNSTTFYFFGKTSTGEQTLISLQHLVRVYGRKDVIQLSISNPESKETLLLLDSQTPEITGDLEKLYEEVEYSVEKRSIDYFNDLVSNIV